MMTIDVAKMSLTDLATLHERTRAEMAARLGATPPGPIHAAANGAAPKMRDKLWTALRAVYAASKSGVTLPTTASISSELGESSNNTVNTLMCLVRRKLLNVRQSDTERKRIWTLTDRGYAACKANT